MILLSLSLPPTMIVPTNATLIRIAKINQFENYEISHCHSYFVSTVIFLISFPNADPWLSDQNKIMRP